jgi:hypothetical protein
MAEHPAEIRHKRSLYVLHQPHSSDYISKALKVQVGDRRSEAAASRRQHRLYVLANHSHWITSHYDGRQDAMAGFRRNWAGLASVRFHFGPRLNPIRQYRFR